MRTIRSLCLLSSLITAVTSSPSSTSTTSSCGTVLKLECQEGEMIVVHEAAFTPHRGSAEECEKGLNRSSSERHNNRDILLAVVRRCSGVRTGLCTFNLRRDLAESQSWGGGRTELGYSCEAGVLSYCGGRVSVSGEGYISSPGYPSYYLGGRECVWTIQAQPGQRIQLEVVDLALRDPGEAVECQDSVEVKEEGLSLLSLCGDLQGRANVASSSRQVELRMRTAASKQSLYPYRGLLLHYSVQGCPTPGPVADGEVEVEADGQTARLSCLPDHVLQASLSQAARLQCDNKSWSWSPPVSHCISVSFLIQYANQSVVKFLTGGRALQLRNNEDGRLSTEFEVELVATVLVGVLLLVSAGIAVFILYKFRKSQDSQEEERVKLSAEGQQEGQVDTSITEMGRY